MVKAFNLTTGTTLDEQTRIVVEELEALVTTNLHRATRLRQSILQKAFEGELV